MKENSLTEIGVNQVIDWYDQIFNELNIPENIKRYVWLNDESFITTLLALGAYNLPYYWPFLEDIEKVPHLKEEILQTFDKIVQIYRNRIQNWEGWIPCDVVKSFVFDERQYKSLLKGYSPNCCCRYATYYHNGFFYVYCAYEIVMKFSYNKLRYDGLYHMTSCFRTSKFEDNSLLDKIFNWGGWEVPLDRYSIL